MSSGCSFRDRKCWQIVVDDDVILEEAEVLLNDKLNPDGSLTFDVYVHVSSSFDTHGDDVTGARADGESPLHVGGNVYRNVNDVENRTTVGTFLDVSTKDGRVMTCLFTNCEGANKTTDCYVKVGSDEVKVGRPVMTLMGNPGVTARNGEPVSFDGMLVSTDALVNPEALNGIEYRPAFCFCFTNVFTTRPVMSKTVSTTELVVFS